MQAFRGHSFEVGEVGAIPCRGLFILHTINEKSSEKHSDEDQNGGFGKKSRCPSPMLEDKVH